jgi:hypothetical protein
VEAVFAHLKTLHEVRHRPTGEVAAFAGKVEQAAKAETTSVDVRTDDYGCVLLRFSNGVHGSVWISQVTPGHKNCIRYEI